MGRFRRACGRIALALSVLAMAGRTPSATVPQVRFFRFDPPVVRQGSTGIVRFEASVDGPPTRVALQINGVETALRDDGAGGDTKAGDGIFTASFPAQTLIGGLTADDVSRHFAG